MLGAVLRLVCYCRLSLCKYDMIFARLQKAVSRYLDSLIFTHQTAPDCTA